MQLIERKLADRSLYNESAAAIAEWQRKHADVARRLEQAEEAWLRAQVALESAAQ
jgi:hypothetical protein